MKRSLKKHLPLNLRVNSPSSQKKLSIKLQKRYAQWSELITSFWDHFQALYLGLFFLIGIGAFFAPFSLIGLILLMGKKKKIGGFVITLLGYLYCSYLYPTLTLKEGVKGEALIHIDQVKQHASPFKVSLVYEVTLKHFKANGSVLRRLPCRLYLRKKKGGRPLANQDYLLFDVSLVEIAPYRYVLKPSKSTRWQPVASSFSFAEWRYQLKEGVRKKLKRHISDKKVYALICALATGDLNNRLLAFEFNQLGLKHLLAISGFHFALVSLLLLTLLRSYLSQRIAAIILLFFLGSYAFYLGNAPSISRAFIAVFLFLIARYFSYRFSVLNALGAALFCALLDKPLIALNIGFQLSFAATLGILLFYSPLEKKLQKLLPKRSLVEMLALLFSHRIGYLISTYLRKALALNGAVAIVTLPLLLCHFQKFPLLSLAYNLFFPLLFSPLVILALITALFSCFSAVTSFYATFLLQLTSYAPRRFTFYLYAHALTPKITIALLFFLLAIGIAIHQTGRVKPLIST